MALPIRATSFENRFAATQIQMYLRPPSFPAAPAMFFAIEVQFLVADYSSIFAGVAGRLSTSPNEQAETPADVAGLRDNESPNSSAGAAGWPPHFEFLAFLKLFAICSAFFFAFFGPDFHLKSAQNMKK